MFRYFALSSCTQETLVKLWKKGMDKKKLRVALEALDNVSRVSPVY